MALRVPLDRFVDVGGVRTRYWMEGEGPVVLLVHGLSNAVEHWLLNIDALAAEHRVYALDLVGQGRTDKPLSRSYALPDLANFVIDFMDAVGIDCADLVGHSLGGALALIIAETAPERAHRLVLIDTIGIASDLGLVLRLVSLPGVGELVTWLALQGGFPKRLKRQRVVWPNPHAVPDEMIRLCYESTRWEQIRKTYFKTLRSSMNVRGMRNTAVQPIVSGLPSLRLPILVVWGEQDDLVPTRHAHILQEQSPAALVELFEGAGHDPMIVDSARFNQLVVRFLASQPPGLPSPHTD